MSNSNDNNGFGKFVPGFEFLQNLIQPGAAAKGMGAGPMAGLGSWVAPTLNVEDLDKRIEELKAVHFWLDQNAKALGATIQALEVQRMTLATLRDLNVSMGDVAKAGGWPSKAAADTAKMSELFAGFAMPAAAPTPAAPSSPPAPAPAPQPQPQPVEPPVEPEEDEAPEAPTAAEPAQKGSAKKAAASTKEVDPLQWWGALQQQFQNIAVNALNDLAQQNVPPMAATGQAKPSAQAKPGAKTKVPAKKAPSSARSAPVRKAGAKVAAAAKKKTGQAASPARKVAAKKASPATKRSVR